MKKMMWNWRPPLIHSRHFQSGQISSSSNESFGLNSVEIKHLRRRINKGKLDLKRKHIYNETYTIKNKYELSQALIKAEVYHDEGNLIGLMKPFGIPRFKVNDEDGARTLVSTLHSSGFASSTSIEEALPLLRKHYNAPNLEVVFLPERYTSGIMLLTYNTKMTEMVKKCFRRSLGLKIPCHTYWAVVHGLTVPESAGEKVATHFRYLQNVGAKVPLIKKEYSIKEAKLHKVQPNIVEHVVLAHHKKNDVSLVEVKVLNDKNHFIRIWLAHCCSPVLGDRVFGGRVKIVMGKRIPLNPNNFSSYQPPDVPRNLLEKLDLSFSQVEIIPPHVHLAKLKLEKNGHNDILITANPPNYFNWTCRKLALMSEESDFGDSGPIAITDESDIKYVDAEDLDNSVY